MMSKDILSSEGEKKTKIRLHKGKKCCGLENCEQQRQLAARTNYERRRRQNARQRALAAQGAPKDPLLYYELPHRKSSTVKSFFLSHELFKESRKKALFKWVIQTKVTDTHKQLIKRDGHSFPAEVSTIKSMDFINILCIFRRFCYFGEFWSISQLELGGANEQKVAFVGETPTKLSKWVIVIFGGKIQTQFSSTLCAQRFLL